MSGNEIKKTVFGDFSHRKVDIVKMRLENYRDCIESLIRMGKIILEYWQEHETDEMLENWLWEICKLFDSCPSCLVFDFCDRWAVKQKGGCK
jgi:hypothetical protein